MAKKNNIRSIRFSDEMIEMIESQAGETFTAKFEALVTRCMWELPRKEDELKRIQERISQEQKNLQRIQKRTRELDDSMWRLESMIRNYSAQMKTATENLEKLTKET